MSFRNKLPIRYAPDDLRPHVPYLIAEPETSCRRLNSDLDTMLVLASDGLWEVATPEQACGWAATHLANHGLASSTCTPPLSLPTPSGITPSTSACAAKARMSALELSRLPPGPERRKFHDDVTVLVVMLPAAQRLVVAGRATSDD